MAEIGDDVRLATIRQRLKNGERTDAARFAAGIANRAQTDEQRRDDADTLAELVRILADGLISAGDKHSGRGRPKGRGKDDSGLALLAELLVPVDYERTLTAKDVISGREVSASAAAALLWWAWIGPQWWEKYHSKQTTKTPDECLSFLEQVLADQRHQHHNHYVKTLREVAQEVITEDRLGDVDAQGFNKRVQQHLLRQYEPLGLTESNLKRAVTKRRKSKPAP